MQTDIVPPKRPNTKIDPHTPMRSLRLRGHSLDSARERLVGMKNLRFEHNLPVQEELPAHTAETESLAQWQPEKKHRRWHHWTKKQQIIALSLCFVLLLGVITGGWLSLHKKQPAQLANVALKTKAAPKPVTEASPLTGVEVAPALAQRPVTGIMMENSLDARPQSGIQEAGVVYEAIAEGGITRFLTLYQEAQPQYIGPVRSLRPYYIDWVAAFDASVAHVGGSPEALAQIRGGGKDLDQFFNSGSYWRSPSRPSPHNVYTSFDRMDALNKAKGYTSSHFTPWPRKEDKKLAVPTAKTIDLAISSALYNSHYDYDAATNSYLRSEGGKAHIATVSADDKTGQQLRPKVVIALIMPYSLSGKYSVYGTTGSGPMYVFQDGGVIQGNWNKPDRPSQFSFTDASNQPIKLNKGQTWITILGAANKVTSAP